MTLPTLLSLDLAAEAAPPLALPPLRNWPASHHIFDAESIWAVNAALASGRPLLLRGEPGAGKSQLARAAAVALGRPFISRVVNARLEPEDLLFRFDAVARLAQAQILPRTDDALKSLTADLFLLPEVLWWAINPEGASAQFTKASPHCGETISRYDDSCTPPLTASSGSVVLIDEIDKADSEVPNSLLETLSVGGFQLPFGGGWVSSGTGATPLIIITTNEDRELPAAFLRRCLVHQMDLPPDEERMTQYLLRRAAAHPELATVKQPIILQAIAQLWRDRVAMKSQDLTPPGQAELLDLLRAVAKLGRSQTEQEQVLERIQSFAFSKHRPG